jgi:TIR domain
VQVFLSYRRSDASGHAGRLTDTLVARLGRGRVFQDVSAIGPGEDFTTAIDGALDRSDAVLAVIGPGWLDATDAGGGRRLFAADDFVHLELARALARNVPVVPVLVGGAALPVPSDLPTDLAGLARRQAATIHDDTWHDDVDGLLRRLEGEQAAPAGPGRPRRAWVIAGALAAVVVLCGAAVAWRAGDGSSGSSADDDVPCPATGGPGWQELGAQPHATAVPTDPSGAVSYGVSSARWRRVGPGRWQVVLAATVANDTPESHSVGSYVFPTLVVARREFAATCFAADADNVAPARVDAVTVGYDIPCEPTASVSVVVGSERQADHPIVDRGPSGAC